MKTSSRPWLASYSGNRLSRRRFLSGAAAGAGAAALIACGGGGGDEGEQLTVDPNGVRTPGAVIYAKDEWKLADESDDAVDGGAYPGRASDDLTESWDPWLANAPTQEDFGDVSYEYLFRWNRGPGVQPGTAESKKVIPHLAESYEVSNDALTYTFTMRRGVKFHPIAPVNAREMTIEDWRTSVDLFISLGANAATFKDMFDKMEYPDSRHMVLKLKYPYAPLLERMNKSEGRDFMFKIVPRELNADGDLRKQQQTGERLCSIPRPEHNQLHSQRTRRSQTAWGHPGGPDDRRRTSAHVREGTVRVAGGSDFALEGPSRSYRSA